MSIVESLTFTVSIEGAGAVPVTLTRRGTGHPVLLLHGGGGPATVTAYADRLAADRPVAVIVPTHPGFVGTARPEALSTIGQLAALYVALLSELDVTGVTVVGNSIGGWIAAEMSLLDTTRVAGFVLVDAVGIDVPGHPVADFFSLTFAELAQRSYHNPAKYQIDPTRLPSPALATMAGNRATLATYAGTAMVDPSLLDRLSGSTRPTLVVFGEADRIVDPDYGRAYADAIPSAQFVLLPESGHLPQIETPDQLTEVLWPFIDDPHSNGLPPTRSIA